MERQITLEGGLLVCDLGELSLEPDGQIVECRLRLTGVQPDRRVAAAVSAFERSPDGAEHPRGVRMVTLPPHSGGTQDVLLTGLRFLLPGDLDVSGGGPRQLVLRAEAHYVDDCGRCLLPE